MACCAIALFLVSQLLRPWRWLRAQFGWPSTPYNDAVKWSLATAMTPAAAQPRAFVATVAFVLIATALTIASIDAVAHASDHPLCSHVARGN
jgi:hypothetical protein